MYCDIITFFAWHDDDIKSHFREVRIDDTPIVCIIGLPFFTHKEIKC